MFLKDTNGQRKLVKRHEVSYGHKGLGLHSAPIGTFKDESQALLDKTKTWNTAIATSYLQRQDIHVSAFTSIFKTIEYVLPATSMTSDQCKTITASLHKKFLSRMGSNQHFSTVYRHAPA